MNLAYLTGPAGSGKTTWLKRRLEADPEFGVLCATTGIAAINLGNASGVAQPTTINSLLGYYNQEGMEDAYEDGRLRSALIRVSKQARNLIPDEVSMMSKEALEVLYLALEDVNTLSVVQDRGGLGLVLTGDFCQLAPIKAAYAFEAHCWQKWEDSPVVVEGDRPSGIIKLDKIHRQTHPRFLEMLMSARAGHGGRVAEIVDSFPGMLVDERDKDFDGVTIFAKNEPADRHNQIRLLKLMREGAAAKTLKSYRWGRQLQEWDKIPFEDTTCMGAYTMALSNDSPMLTYANGDCGHIVDWDGDEPVIVLSRPGGGRGDGTTVRVRKVVRQNSVKPSADMPAPGDMPSKQAWMDLVSAERVLAGQARPGDHGLAQTYKQYLQEITARERAKVGPRATYFDYVTRRWVIGEVVYVPIRPAYACTVHKTQGLTLDKVQIVLSSREGGGFFYAAAMMYVAMSRVRGPEGLTIVGDLRMVENRTNVAEEVLRWV